MPDLVHSKTLLDLELESMETKEMYLRIKYIGKNSEQCSAPIPIKVSHTCPYPPVVTLDSTDIQPGQGLNADGGTFRSSLADDEHIFTDWKVTTDPEGRDVVNIAGRLIDPTSAIADDFIDHPSGTYYISARYQGKTQWSEWSVPVPFTWTNWNIPDEYWQNQITIFDQVLQAATSAQRANLDNSWWMERTITLRMDNMQLFDVPLRTTSFGINAGGKHPNYSNAVALPTVITGPWTNPNSVVCYGDTFVFTVMPSPGIFNINKKGCALASDTVPNRQFFDLSKTDGKFVTIVKDTNLDEFYLAINFKYASSYVRVWVVKKARAFTDRSDVSGTLMVI